jgi:hypothetical protein
LGSTSDRKKFELFYLIFTCNIEQFICGKLSGREYLADRGSGSGSTADRCQPLAYGAVVQSSGGRDIRRTVPVSVRLLHLLQSDCLSESTSTSKLALPDIETTGAVSTKWYSTQHCAGSIEITRLRTAKAASGQSVSLPQRAAASVCAGVQLNPGARFSPAFTESCSGSC